MKRTLSMVLTICLMMSMLPTSIFSISASASEVSAPISATQTGTCGDSARWVYYEETGELKILGSGAITGELYASGQMKDPPWSSFAADVKSISVANGITSIPQGAFRSCINLESLSVPFLGKSRTANEGFDQVLGHVFGCTNSNVAGTTLQYEKYVYNGAIYYYLYGYYYIPATLKEVIITDGTKISGNPFRNCKNIRSVGLSDSIVSISSSVFSSCSRIADVWYEGTEDEKNNISIGSYNSYLTSATWHFDSCIKISNKITHSFDDCEDSSCNNCDRVRSAPGHLYNYCTDTKCSNCDKIRVALKHTYSNCTDKTCDSCSFVRADEHQYQNNCDADCDVCGYIRVPSEHVYSNEWDTTCDECGPYDITYHLDGGTNALKNPDVYTLEDNIVLKDATKAGYSFAGWYINEEKTQKITNISNRTGNIDLYAKFVPYSYDATFIGNGADKLGSVKITLISEETYESKEVYVEGGDSFNPYDYWSPIAPGYVFLGWLYNDVVIDESIEINESSGIQIKAKWKEMTTVAPVLYYSYKLSAKDQSSVSFYTSNDACYITWSAYSQSYTSPHGTTWRSSWSISANGSYVDRSYIHPGYRSGSAYIEPGTLVTVYCSMDTGLTSEELDGWINISYSSTRCNDGEFFVSKNNQIIQQEFDSPINTPSLSKNGYRFVGWYDESGNKMTETWQYTENQTFTAKWEPISYTITYNLGGGINNASNPSTYTIEDSVTLQPPSKAGYTFKGWYTDSNFTTKVTSISKEAGSITLYAKWEVNSYNLTVDANEGAFAPKVTFMSDGAAVNSLYLYEQNSVVAYRPANKAGYIFAGWYRDDSFTNLFKFNGTITEDITLYAKWIECSDNIINIERADSLAVTINGKSEQLYAFVPLVDGTIVVTSASDGLDLYGILYDATKSQLIAADDISDSDLDFSYTYNIKAGQLYYIAVKGNTASTSGEATISVDWTGSCTITGTTYPNRQLSVVYGTDYKLPEKPKREGYIFLGWFDETDTQITDGIWSFTTDKTLTAKWESVADHIHSYNIWSNYDGNQHIRECICGESEYADHEWNSGVVTTQPTHTTEGVRTYSCSVCSGTKTESIKKLPDHTFGKWGKYDDVQHVRECECGEKEYADHTISAWEKYDDNQHIRQCECGESEYADHEWDSGVVTTQPTHTIEGVRTYSCSVCSGTKTESISKLPDHTFGAWGRYDDNQHIRECECDEKEYADHEWDNGTITTQPTYTTEGVVTYTCAECDATKTTSLPSLSAAGIVFTLNDAGTEYSVTDCTGNTTEIVIPITFEGLPVTSIGEEAFSDCDGLTSVVIPDSITSIGYRAFAWCRGLTSITFGENSQLTSIGSSAFYYCDNLTSILIPTNVTNIASYAFEDCHALSSITFDENSKLTNIGGNAFDCCSSLTSITIPSGVISIGEDAFYGCSGLTSIAVKDGNTTYHSASNCLIETESKILIIGCKNSVIPTDGSVTSIGEKAFYSCDGLTSINIPWSVTSIGEDAFCYCSNLTSITVAENNTTYHSVGNCIIERESKTLIIGCKNSVIPTDGSVTSIGKKAFYSCDGLTSINIPWSVTSIGEEAFSDCDGLTSVVIPDSITSIGYRAFAWCRGLTSITFGENSQLTSIGSSAFYYCDNLTSILIPTNVTNIASYAFEDCHALSSITFGENSKLTSLGESAFDCCSSLTSITIPSGVTSIGEDTFYGCSALTSIIIPKSVTSIGETAFQYCSSLASITFESSRTEIYDSKNTIPSTAIIYGCSDSTAEAYATKYGRTFVSIHDHEYVSVVTEPTCTESGYTTHTCHCGYILVDSYVDAFGHTDGAAADCENAQICTVCGEVLNTAIGHNYKAEVTAPDCVNGGYTTYTCSKCGDSYVADYTAALGHTYDSDLDADCNVCGDVRIISGISGDCTWTLDGTHLTISGNGKMLDYSSSSSIPWYGKTITSVTLESGVTSIGKGAFYNCRFLTSVTIPDSVTTIGEFAFNHCSSLISVTIPDSVTAIGFAAFNTCEALTSVTIPDSVTAIGDYTFGACESLRSVTISNSVTSIGEWAFGGCESLTDVYYHGSKADRANISVGDYNDYLLNATWHYAICSHEYVGTVTTPADCVNTGVMTYTCSNCGDNYTEELPALGHTEEIIPDKAATCTEDGLTEGKKCSVCGEILVAQEIIPATGHTEEIIPGKAATCTEDGLTEGKHCSECGVVFIAQTAIDALGHTEGEWIIDKEATATEEGSKRQVCSVCGEIIKTETIPKVVHDYKSEVKAPTATEDGLIIYTCSHCGDSYNEVITPVGITIDSNNTNLIGYDYRADKLVIPAVFCKNNTWYRVTGIGYVAFYLGKFSSVTIPESVTSIGLAAFGSCDNLTSVYIPNSVISIGESAFSGCDNLTSLTIGNGVTSIGKEAFYCCVKLKSVVFSTNSQLTSIGDSAFHGCYKLANIIIPPSVTSIGNLAFFDCDGLTSITIPNNVTSIGERAFAASDSLTSIVVEDNNEYYKSVDGNLYTKNGETLVQYATGKNDTFFIIPDSVTSISKGAFWRVLNLKSITIPRSVTDIGDYAFEWCSPTIYGHSGSVAEVYATEHGKSFVAISGSCGNNLIWNFDPATKVLTISGRGAMDDYSSVSLAPWKSYGVKKVIIEDGVTSIGDYAFSPEYGSVITEITIPNSVLSIGNYAFYNCSSLTEISLPDSVASIGTGAFSMCGLTTITIPGSVTSIGSSAFATCTSLNSVTISDGVVSIGDWAFGGCWRLAGEITIPDSVSSIGWMTFQGCTAVTKITILSHTVDIYNSGDTFPHTATICGYIGSTAEVYATKYSRAFVELSCPHSFTKEDTTYLMSEATCIAPAIYYKSCEYCGEKGTETFEMGDALGHSYNNGVITTEPTCTENGVKTFACGTCGGTYTEAVDATGHDHDAAVTAPTCTAKGYTTYTCHCGDSYVGDEVPALGHTYDDDQDPDCNICGAVREVVVILYGDTNGDGKVNNRDLGLLQQHLNGWGVTIDLVSADVNNDGKVNNRDLGLLQQYLNGWGVTLG